MKTEPDKWGTPITRDYSGVETLRNIRGVRSFDQFPPNTQAVYLAVARCFPDVQVWACGSRVRGDYVLPDDGDWIREQREKAGMKPKQESDFDFWIEGTPEPVEELPPNTEQAKCRVPENEKVMIPIYVGLVESA